MKYTFILLLFICFSCGKEKTIQLPHINHSTIRDIKDVSAAYIFYDENEKDSVEFNRKNLIISTNWLVNLDKRLTLQQAIPYIQKLQEKKRNAQMHKNKAAKNYYSCNDISIKNLGFIDFTDVIYHNGIDENSVENHSIYQNKPTNETNHIVSILFKTNDSITINSVHTTKSQWVQKLRFMDSIQNKMTGIVYLKFNKNLTFQEYITYKSMLDDLNLRHASVSNDEYIFD